VDQTADPDHALYNMIIVSDLMKELGINLIYSHSVMTWEQNNEVQMKPCGTISSSQCAKELYCIHVEETLLLQVAENWKIKVIDSD
jgi:hypothetical protein